MLRPRTILGVTLVAALVVFAVVQDRVTASGARQYVTLQRAALAAGGAPITIEQVMRPAIRRSARQGSMWAAMVMAGGLAVSWFLVPGSGFRVPGSEGEP